MENKIEIFQSSNGEIEFSGDIENETIWATQKQIVKIFGKNRTVITRHINNILKDNEVEEKSNVQKMHIANSDNPVKFYSLDIILAVGYRTNSSSAIEFRKWATSVLNKYLLNGYAINKKNITKTKDILNNLKQTINLLTTKNMNIK